MGERHPPPSAPPPPVGLIYSASLYPPNLKVMRLEAKAGWAGRATRRGHAAIFFGRSRPACPAGFYPALPRPRMSGSARGAAWSARGGKESRSSGCDCMWMHVCLWPWARRSCIRYMLTRSHSCASGTLRKFIHLFI